MGDAAVRRPSLLERGGVLIVSADPWRLLVALATLILTLTFGTTIAEAQIGVAAINPGPDPVVAVASAADAQDGGSRSTTATRQRWERAVEPARGDFDAVHSHPPSDGMGLGDDVDSSAPRTPRNDFQVVDPLNPGRTITDIDTFRAGQLVELKLATSAADPQAWIQKHIVRRAESYLEARQHIPGWQQADIVFEFTKPGVDPAFVPSVNEAVTGLDATTPGVTISVRWAP